jgi:RimJ/RimL family protein N-acetyltransferase
MQNCVRGDEASKLWTCLRLLEGKRVNLRLVEKEDLKLFTDFLNDLDMGSLYMPILQQSETQIEERHDKLPQEEKWFFVENKDGNRIGWISHSLFGGSMTIEYALIPSERSKGNGTEAVLIIVDYLFLSKNIVRVQAETLAENLASQRALEKAGFTKEAVKRQSSFVRGLWRDDVLYSILREEWKEPKILKS